MFFCFLISVSFLIFPVASLLFTLPFFLFICFFFFSFYLKSLFSPLHLLLLLMLTAPLLMCYWYHMRPMAQGKKQNNNKTQQGDHRPKCISAHLLVTWHHSGSGFSWQLSCFLQSPAIPIVQDLAEAEAMLIACLVAFLWHHGKFNSQIIQCQISKAEYHLISYFKPV